MNGGRGEEAQTQRQVGEETQRKRQLNMKQYGWTKINRDTKESEQKEKISLDKRT